MKFILYQTQQERSSLDRRDQRADVCSTRPDVSHKSCVHQSSIYSSVRSSVPQLQLGPNWDQTINRTMIPHRGNLKSISGIFISYLLTALSVENR